MIIPCRRLLSRGSILILTAALFAHAAFAADITGTVSNGTRSKPSAGDDVVLLRLAGTMEEIARGRTDAQGHFTLKLPDAEASAPHLVRVIHQKVNYHRAAPPGTSAVEVQVFDVAPKLEGMSTVVNIMRIQAAGSTLSVTQLFAVKNASNPPRTLMSDQSYAISLPAGAQIESSMAEGPGGMPVKSAPVPTGGKDRYAFVFPLRPGETRFQVSYHLPYNGRASFAPKIFDPVEHMVVMLPKSMQFGQHPNAATYTPSLEERGMNVYVTTSVTPSQDLSFDVSGTGEMPRDAAGAGSEADAASDSGAPGAASGDESAPGGAQKDMPGGGLGRPIETPDPLHQYRWYILGSLASLLALGAWFTVSRAPREVPLAAGFPGNPPELSSTGGGRSISSADRSSALLDALKEELFALESERIQGKISPEEYGTAKASLEVTLQRALARAGKNA